MKTEKKMVNIRMSETLVEALKEESERLEIPQSQFVRDAIKDKIAVLKQTSPVQQSPQVEVAVNG